jgi:hypothetical protein
LIGKDDEVRMPSSIRTFGYDFHDAGYATAIASIAGIQLACKVDGLNLSHNLLGGEGKDRDHVLMSFKKEFFVRDKRFRLDQDGTLYDTPVTSDKVRYSEKQTMATEHLAHRERLQYVLNEFMAIDQASFGAAESKKKSDAP